MYLMTTHRTFVGVSGDGTLVQVDASVGAAHLLQMDDFAGFHTIASGALGGFVATRLDNGISFRKGEHFLCAERGATTLIANRSERGAWETFVPIPIDQLDYVAGLYQSADREIARFVARVDGLRAKGQPVKIYCGCGDIIRNGFLHIDVTMFAPAFALSNTEDYFLFPFADRAWGLPDASVDYIFHEDFIEHIDQLQQIQFLAETFRVLKKGGWHRVNTPNLIDTMTRHSTFADGFKGVYTGEKDLWSHVSLLTPDYLAEIAGMIGYRKVAFTKKSKGRSPFAVPDLRPYADRDGASGNIFADLRK